MVRHPWLLLLPIVFDVLMWAVPPLTIGPILQREVFAPFNPQNIIASPAADPQMVAQLTELYQVLNQQLGTLNMWGWFVPTGLFWPSVMVGTAANVGGAVWAIEEPLAILGIFIGLTLFGILINVIWLHGVAFATTHHPPLLHASVILRSFLRVVGIAITLLLILLGGLFALSMVLSLITLLLPGVGPILATFLGLASLWLVFWVGVQLYVTAATVVVGNQGVLKAPVISASFIRFHFWSALGFILICTILTGGFGLIFNSLRSTPAGTLISIIGNAALGTGIATAMVVFFAQRALALESEPVAA